MVFWTPRCHLSWEGLGPTLLHEFTHFVALVSPPLPMDKEVDDHEYGPYSVRARPPLWCWRK